MQLTSTYQLKKPDYADTVDVQDLNGNADKIDAELSKKLDKTGEGGDLTVSFTQGPGKVNLKPGEKLSASLGKIMKWLSEMKAVAVTGNYNDLSNRPSIPSGAAASCNVANNDTTTAGGYVADARIVRQHGLEIDQAYTILGGLQFKEEGGVKYVRGADTVWVPLCKQPIEGSASCMGNPINGGVGSATIRCDGYNKLTLSNVSGTYRYIHFKKGDGSWTTTVTANNGVYDISGYTYFACFTNRDISGQNGYFNFNFELS